LCDGIITANLFASRCLRTHAHPEPSADSNEFADSG